jgi:hypothetical protein
MPVCPQCARPIAVARPSCLYCGAAIDPALLPVAPAAAPPTEPWPENAAPESEPNRAVVVVPLESADAGVVATALGLSSFEALQRVRRGGWQVHRILPAAAADGEAERLRAAGLGALVIPGPELAIAEEPMLALGGRSHEGGLALRVEGRTVNVSSAELLLLVTGTIQREITDVPKAKRQRLGQLQPGLRFHFHLHREARPLELDPDSFALDEPPAVPSAPLLEVRAWMAALSPPPTVDEGFKDVTPALSAAPAPEPSLRAALGAVTPRDPDVTVLDNLRQFRFYSAWQAAVARRTRPR